jgi:hypothetical protein
MVTPTGASAVAIVGGLLYIISVWIIEKTRNNRKGEPRMVSNKKFLAMMNRLPLTGQRLGWVDFLRGNSSDDEVQDTSVVLGAPLEEANIITSLMDLPNSSGMDMHKIVLDIDHKVTVVESSTAGHSHLYVDVMMPWEHVVKLMEVMAEIGLVEPGYVNASKARGYTAVRLPWISKEQLSDEEVRGA